MFESSEEQAYYNLVAIMNLVKSAIESKDPEAILGAIDMLASIGFTDEEIATYLGNLPLSVLTYQQFLLDYYNDGEGNPYADELAWALDNLAYWQAVFANDLFYAQENLDYWQNQLAMILNVGTTSIPAITDVTARNATLAYWNLKIENSEKGLLYYWSKEEAETNPSWNYDTFYGLQYDLEYSIYYVSYEAYDYGWGDPVTAMNYRNDYDAAFALLSPDEQAMYGAILSLYENYYTQNVNALAEANDAFFDSFWSAPTADLTLMNSVGTALSNYWYTLDNLHDAQAWLMDVTDYYAADLAAAENHVAEIQALYDSYVVENYEWLIAFFADPENDILWNSITGAFVGEVDNITSNITPELIELVSSFFLYQQLQGQIDNLQWHIQSLEWQLTDCFTEAENAIALLDDPTSSDLAQEWWDVNVEEAQMWAEYSALIESSWEDPFFNPDTYFYLEGQTDSAVYEELVNMNPAGGAWYRNEIAFQLSWATPGEAFLYQSLLAVYEAYRSNHYLVVHPAENAYYEHRSSGEDYDSQLQWAQNALYDSQEDLSYIINEANNAIASIADVDARSLTQSHWTWSTAESQAYYAYYMALDQAQDNPSWDSFYFQYALVEPLQNSIYYNSYTSGLYGYTDTGLAGWNSLQFNQNMNDLELNNPAAFALYAPLSDLYAIYYSIDQNQQAQAQNEFWNYYYASATGFDEGLMLNVDSFAAYQYQSALFAVYWSEQDVAYWQSMVDSAGESAWEYYYVDELVWTYRDRLAQLRSAEQELFRTQESIASLLDLTPAGLAGYAQTVAAFIGVLGDSIDPIEAQALADFLYAVTALHLERSGLYTEEEQIALLAEIEGVFEYYIDGILYAPDMISLFLANLTADEIQTIMDAIAAIDALEGIDPDLDNMIRAVAMADVIIAVAGDGILDVDFIVEMAVYGYFDGMYHLHYDGTLDVAARILYLQTLIGEILLQADVIDAYDPYFLTEGERIEINEFHLLVEELMPYFQNGPDYDPVV